MLCVLDIARVQFKVCRLEQALAEAKLEETVILGNLYNAKLMKWRKGWRVLSLILGTFETPSGTAGALFVTFQTSIAVPQVPAWILLVRGPQTATGMTLRTNYRWTCLA